MGRNMFVTGGPAKLMLADVHRRRHAELMEKGVLIARADEAAGKPAKHRPATPEEIAESADRLEAAVEDGYWVEVKPQLTAGESRRAFAKLSKEMGFNERAKVDVEQLGWAKVVEYVLGWNLCDENGTVPYSEEALANLLPPVYGVIEEAVDRHEADVLKAQESRKNVQAGETRSSAT